jgi:hypothetical protein
MPADMRTSALAFQPFQASVAMTATPAVMEPAVGVSYADIAGPLGRPLVQYRDRMRPTLITMQQPIDLLDAPRRVVRRRLRTGRP